MKNTLLIAGLGLSMLPVAAQSSMAGKGSENESSDSRIEFVKTANNPDLKEILKKDREKENNNVEVPHFAIRTRDNKFALTIGGQINTIIGGDLGNDLYQNDNAGISFVTSQIPVPAQTGKKSDFYINPLNANVDFQVVGFGGTDNQITGYIKIGTNGVNNQLKMKKAYLSWRGFTVGQKNTLFQDNAASQPPTIDPQGPCGMVSTTAYELSYITPSFNGFRAAVGVDMPSYYSSNGVYRGKDYKVWDGEEIAGQPVADPTAYNQNVPDLPLWVEYAKSEFNRIRLSAIIRNFSYKNLLTDKHHHSVGWGMMLSGNYNPVEPLIFYATAAYGKGIGAYIQDLQGMPLSFIPDDAKPGKMTPSPMMGVTLGATYNITPKWQVNAMASEARIWKVAPYAEAAAQDPGNYNDYRYGFYAAGNVFYNISSYLQVGIEYLYGHRQTWGHGSASDSRVQMQIAFTL